MSDIYAAGINETNKDQGIGEKEEERKKEWRGTSSNCVQVYGLWGR